MREPAVLYGEDLDPAHLGVVVFGHGHVPHRGDGGVVGVGDDPGDLNAELLDADSHPFDLLVMAQHRDAARVMTGDRVAAQFPDQLQIALVVDFFPVALK